jgi:hypothetical protein
MNGLGYPEIERDLLFVLVGVEDVLVHAVVTSGHVSGSWIRWHQPLFFGIPCTPTVGGTAGNVQVLDDPDFPTTILIVSEIVAGTLSTEPLTEPVEQRCQVLLRKLLVLFPCGYDFSLEFFFTQLVEVGLARLCRFDSSIVVHACRLWCFLWYLRFCLVGQKHTCISRHPRTLPAEFSFRAEAHRQLRKSCVFRIPGALDVRSISPLEHDNDL